jgi:hypothetical protein
VHDAHAYLQLCLLGMGIVILNVNLDILKIMEAVMHAQVGFYVSQTKHI